MSQSHQFPKDRWATVATVFAAIPLVITVFFLLDKLVGVMLPESHAQAVQEEVPASSPAADSDAPLQLAAAEPPAPAEGAKTGDKRVDYQAELPKSPPVTKAGYHRPPAHGDYPEGPFGEAVKRGEKLFTETSTYAARFVGNGMECRYCHLDAGRVANSAPMWGAWTMYPAYRKKNDHVNSMEERIRGCFTYSMNAQDSEVGHAPEPGDPLLTDMMAYMYWLAKGAPTGEKLPGRGYPKLDKPEQAYDPKRGKVVYEAQCAVCHGADGQGQKAEGRYVFPALWGKESFNWGAGMHRINTAAGFIKANMPLGKPDSLSLQDAWDVAAYINSHERPSDPRNKGDLADTDAKFHSHQCYYGEHMDGHTLGEGS